MKVGIDIVEVERFENKSQAFYKKLFTKNEINYCKTFKNPAEHFAGFFAVKEAVMKTFGVGIEDISFRDIEVTHDEFRKPIALLFGTAKNFLDKKTENNIEISISHTKKIATAIAILF